MPSLTGALSLALHDEQVEVGRRLQDGEHLAERVEVIELRSRRVQVRTLAASNAVAEPGEDGAFGGVQAGGVMGQEFVHPGVDAGGDRAVRGEQYRIRELPDQPQRLQVVGERRDGQGRLEPDRRRDLGEHVIPGEQQAEGRIPETQVPPGVTGGPDRLQDPGSERDVARYQPLVGQFPERLPVVPAGRVLLYLVRQADRAAAAQSPDLGSEPLLPAGRPTVPAMAVRRSRGRAWSRIRAGG